MGWLILELLAYIIPGMAEWINLWLFAAFIIPVLVAWINGCTYKFALFFILFGIMLNFLSMLLVHFSLHKQIIKTHSNRLSYQTTEIDIVPRWKSVIGLIGIGFLAAGLILLVLLWMQVIARK